MTWPRSRWDSRTWSREPKVVKVDPKLYDAYVGRYEADPFDEKERREITVSTSSGRLMIQPKNEPKFEAVPESETRFYLKTADGLAEFVRGPDGAVNVVEMLLANRKFKAGRAPATAKPGDTEATKPKAIGNLPASPGPGMLSFRKKRHDVDPNARTASQRGLLAANSSGKPEVDSALWRWLI